MSAIEWKASQARIRLALRTEARAGTVSRLLEEDIEHFRRSQAQRIRRAFERVRIELWRIVP